MKLVYFMGKVISSRVWLDRQLQLSHNIFVDPYLQGHVTYRNLVCETTFNLNYPKPFFLVSESKSFDLFDGEDNVRDTDEYTLASKHIANLESYIAFVSEQLVDFTLVIFILTFDSFFDTMFINLSLIVLIFSDEHFFFDSNHSLLIRSVRI